MTSGIYSLTDAALVQVLRFDSISNNLANINTNGFKKDVISFHQALTMENNSKTDFAKGPVRHTGNKLDLALDGFGFFKIQTPKGIRYTRDGAFTLNGDRFLVTQKGDTVLGENGPIQINGSHVSIGTDGQVLVENEPIDKILAVDFKQPELLKKEGRSQFIYQGEEKDIFPPENVRFRQTFLEASNVNPTEEMIKMMEALRAFESAEKAIQSMDEMTQKMINDSGLYQ